MLLGIFEFSCSAITNTVPKIFVSDENRFGGGEDFWEGEQVITIYLVSVLET